MLNQDDFSQSSNFFGTEEERLFQLMLKIVNELKPDIEGLYKQYFDRFIEFGNRYGIKWSEELLNLIGVSRMGLGESDLQELILNVEKAMHHKVFENEEIRNIFTALGVTVGTEEDSKALNISKLRYHKVIIMCDADVDGSHIETLILTFFFRHMKELIEKGYIYIATPPLYLVKKGKKAEYAWSDEQRDMLIHQLSS